MGSAISSNRKYPERDWTALIGGRIALSCSRCRQLAAGGTCMHLSLRRSWGALAALAIMFAATPARADVILLNGNVPQIDENVLLATAGTGDPIFGLTNQTGLAVEFNSNETVTSPSSGQARVEAVDQTLSQLAISVVSGSFTSLIFNLNAVTTGTVNFTAMDTQGDAFNFSRMVSAGGQNFFTFVAIN